MDKKQLMEYLKAVCSGEAALYACNEAVQNLEGRIRNLYNVEIPNDRPTPRSVNVKKEPVGCGLCILGAIAGFIAFYISAAIADSSNYPNGPTGLGTFITIVVGIVVAVAVPALISWGSYNAKYQTAAEAAALENQKALAEFQRRVDKAKADNAMIDFRRKSFRQLIEENNRTGARIRNELDNLYSKNIIHERFRSFPAVSQIYEYLDTGVCDTLEGPHGAYAMYYNDIHANHICQSINDLRTAMQRGMNSVLASQSLLIKEIRSVDNNVRALDSSVQSGFNSVREGIDAETQKVGSVFSSLEASNQHLTNIERTLSTTAHNLYVEQRENFMKDYLLRNPD